MKTRKNHTLGIRLDDATYRAIEKFAQKERRTISDLIRLWIEDRLAKEAKPKKIAS